MNGDSIAPRRSEYWQKKRVLVTGGTGFVGRNLLPLLSQTGCDVIAPTRRDYDLIDQVQVRKMFAEQRPDVVFNLAGLVGGIGANRQSPGDYCYQNLMIGAMLLHEAWRAGVKKYVTLMGGCSYPSHAPSPIKETELWNGYPHPDSAPYSLAKAMSSPLAQAYRAQHNFNAIVLVPGNLYGPHDNFDLEKSHVVPALVRKFHEARVKDQKEVTVWGTGRPVRDFIYVGDACEAILIAAESYNGSELINISSGVQVTIGELVKTIAELTGYQGKITWDTTKPEGQMLKGFDVTRMHEWLGYHVRTPLREGLAKTIAWFEAHYAQARLEVAA